MSLFNLALIEKNLEKYSNDERVAPTQEVIDRVRTFLKGIDDPPDSELFVSPNGAIVVKLDEGSYRFDPDGTRVFLKKVKLTEPIEGLFS